MPVYECYCPDCHTIFNFFSRRIDTDTRPACPRCGRPELARQASLFAISKGRGDRDRDPEADGGGPPPGVDEARLMQALTSMAGELEHLDDADPRQAARLMRRLFETGGLNPEGTMAEMIRRMEAGEDPDALDAELGEQLDQEDPVAALTGGETRAALYRLRRVLLPAARDDTWYPLRGQDQTAD